MNTKDFIKDLKAEIVEKLKSPRYITAKFFQGDMSLDDIRTELGNIAQDLGIELKSVEVDGPWGGPSSGVTVIFVQHNDDTE